MRYEPREHIIRELADWLFDGTNTDTEGIADALGSFPDWASWSLAYHPFMQRVGAERMRTEQPERLQQLDQLEALLTAEHLRRIEARRP